jgi:hypothetical protein
MEAPNATSTETATVDSTTSVDTSTQTAASTDTTAQASATGTATTEGTPAWTPDWKFKAAGKEHEIPETYRGLAKDQNSLDEIKRLHEKAYGVDALVQSRDTLKRQYAELQPRLQEYENVTKSIEKLEFFVQNKDFDSFFQALGIPDKAIIGWIQEKIDLQGAAPEVRAQYEKSRQLTSQQWEQQQELSRYKATAEEYEQHKAYQTVETSVTQLAGDIAQSYDSKMGQGAFVDFVINKGIQLTQAFGREPSLEQVIEIAKSELSKLGVYQPPQAVQSQASVGTTTTSAPKQKPTIPIVPAGGQSPIKQPIKSMKDLIEAQKALGD